MTRFLTLVAATLATASAQYGGGSPMQGSSNMGMQEGGMQQNQQQGSSSGGGMSSMMNMSPWQGMQQSSNAQQVGIVIIATNAGGSSQWKQMSSSNDMYMKNSMPMTHQVTVGAPGLKYTPDTIMAAPGDYVQFNFMSQNHTATQSNFDKPCVKMMGGADSGFMPNMNNGTNPPPAMKMQVMNTMPMCKFPSTRSFPNTR
jgi:plastocyanin